MIGLTNIKDVLYILKNTFGVPIKVYKPISLDQNVLTGIITKEYTKMNISKAIVATSKELRELGIVQNQMKVNGVYETYNRFIIIDKRDLPFNTTVDTGCVITYDNSRYEVINVQPTAERYGYMLAIKAASNAQIIED